MNILLSLLFCLSGSAQGLLIQGAQLVIGQNAHVVVADSLGNFQADNQAKVQNRGVLHVQGNWINNSQLELLSSDTGLVIFYGFNRYFGGSSQTRFHRVVLKDSGSRRLDQDIVIGNQARNRWAQLEIENQVIDLNAHTLNLESEYPDVLRFAHGGILSESLPSEGYGQIYWQLGSTSGNGIFQIPWLAITGERIEQAFQLTAAGSTFLDSAGLYFSTYPTNYLNRPLPFGVTQTDNTFGKDHASNMVDRFWIIQPYGYMSSPEASLSVVFEEGAALGSNTIFQEELAFSRYTNGAWDFDLKGATDTLKNETQANMSMNGVWAIVNPIECPLITTQISGHCQGEKITFESLPQFRKGQVDGYYWEIENQGIEDSIARIQFSNYGQQVIYHRVELSSGCSDSLWVQKRIDPQPNASFELGKAHCLGQTLSFYDQSLTVEGTINKFNWNFGDGEVSTIQNPQRRFAEAGVYNVELIAENSLACRDTFTQSVKIYKNPKAGFDLPDLCEASWTAIDNQSIEGDAPISLYQWDLNNSVYADKEPQHRFSGHGIFPVSLIVSDTNRCADTLNKQVEVFRQAMASFRYSPEEVSYKDPLVHFQSTSSFASDYTWSFGDGSLGFSPKEEHEYQDSGRYLVSLIANNSNGCADTSHQEVYVTPYFKIYMPNAFTPNGDAHNEEFGIEGFLQGIHDYQLKIYNRWGQLIFSSNQPENKWNGTFGGSPVPMGTYTYIIEVRDYESRNHLVTGTVELIR